jgi:hypothetical protein
MITIVKGRVTNYAKSNFVKIRVNSWLLLNI